MIKQSCRSNWSGFYRSSWLYTARHTPRCRTGISRPAALDHAQNIEDLWPFPRLGHSRQRGHRPERHRRSREVRRLLRQALRVVENLENPAPLLYANHLAQQIMAALRRTEPEMAAERMHVLARIPPLVTSARPDRQAKEIVTASTPWAAAPETRDAHNPLRNDPGIAPAGSTSGHHNRLD